MEPQLDKAIKYQSATEPLWVQAVSLLNQAVDEGRKLDAIKELDLLETLAILLTTTYKSYGLDPEQYTAPVYRNKAVKGFRAWVENM